jgi:hypothetical protein
MRRKKPQKLSEAQGREWTAKEITRLTHSLDIVRAQMIANVGTWKYEQMKAALTQANNIRKERDKLMR